MGGLVDLYPACIEKINSDVGRGPFLKFSIREVVEEGREVPRILSLTRRVGRKGTSFRKSMFHKERKNHSPEKDVKKTVAVNTGNWEKKKRGALSSGGPEEGQKGLLLGRGTLRRVRRLGGRMFRERRAIRPGEEGYAGDVCVQEGSRRKSRMRGEGGSFFWFRLALVGEA